MGELEVRGPSIASAYYDSPDGGDRWTDDGWFKTGDIVTIHPDGYVGVQDRAKDLVKSGGEWISTMALENALMGHPAVLEAAVIAVPDERWMERPLAVVVLREGQTADADELRAFLRRRVREVLAPGPLRVRRRDSEDGGRKVPQDCPAGAVRIVSRLEEEHLGNVRQHRARGPSRGRHDRQSTPERALGGARGRARDGDRQARRRRGDPRDRPPRSRRARLRRGRRHQGVPGVARGRWRGGWSGARASFARPPDGRGAHAVRGGDQGLLPRRRPRARHVLRRQDLRRRRQARAARSQARPDPGRRWDAAAASARRQRPREPAQPRGRAHRRRHGVRVGPRRAGRPVRPS